MMRNLVGKVSISKTGIVFYVKYGKEELFRSRKYSDLSEARNALRECLDEIRAMLPRELDQRTRTDLTAGEVAAGEVC